MFERERCMRIWYHTYRLTIDSYEIDTSQQSCANSCIQISINKRLREREHCKHVLEVQHNFDKVQLEREVLVVVVAAIFGKEFPLTNYKSML
jgi:hypothetical protein